MLEFATTIRSRGVDAILDQWDLRPGDDLPEFMEQNLASADYAVMICTPRYVSKANEGKGGVGYEKMIMTASSLTTISGNKVIPVIREKGEPLVPTFLSTKLYVDFSNDSDIEFSFDELLRVLLDAPLYQKPEIGANHFQPMEGSRPNRTADGVREVMKTVADNFDRTHFEQVYMQDLVKGSSLRRLTLDKYLAEAVELGYVTISNQVVGMSGRAIRITDEGRRYLESTGIVDA